VEKSTSASMQRDQQWNLERPNPPLDSPPG
jgi:hypothetical protein